MIQMPFSQIQQAPGLDFREVGKSLETLKPTLVDTLEYNNKGIYYFTGLDKQNISA